MYYIYSIGNSFLQNEKNIQMLKMNLYNVLYFQIVFIIGGGWLMVAVIYFVIFKLRLSYGGYVLVQYMYVVHLIIGFIYVMHPRHNYLVGM